MNTGYTVGDRVVVCDGVRRCLYGATKQMIELIGKEAEITDIGFSIGHNAVYYRISLGSPGLKWCDNCFLPVDEEVAPITDDEFFAIAEFLSSSH